MYLLCSVTMGQQAVDTSALCDNLQKFINHGGGNFFVNFDTISSNEEYFHQSVAAQYATGKPIQVVPFVVDDSIGIITLDTILPLIGGGYVWDPRSHFSIFFNGDQLSTQWYSKGNCDTATLKNHYNDLNYESLGTELSQFWETNEYMESNSDSIFDPIFNVKRKAYKLTDLEVVIMIRKTSTTLDHALITTIVEAYIAYFERLSQSQFNTDLCSISKSQLTRLKARLPLRIQIRRTFSMPYRRTLYKR